MSKKVNEEVALPLSLDLQMDYRKYGGMYVPDPFTVTLNEMVDEVKKLENNADFESVYRTALSATDFSMPEIEYVGKMLDSEVYKIPSMTSRFIISGFLALAKVLDLTPTFAVESEEDLKIFIAAAQALNLKPYVVLNKAFGSNNSIKSELEGYGYKVDVEKCATLFNEPILYAFQYYISNVTTTLYIPVDSNVGPYPYLSITSAFIDGYAKVLKEVVAEKFDKLPVAVLAEGVPGTSAVAAFKAFENSDVRMITYEKPFDHEREDCYCGVYTKVVEVEDEEKVLSPELILGWENGEVDRVFAKDYNSAIAAIEQSGVVLIVEEK